MSNTIRIKTTPNGGDKYVKVKLEQEFDFLEVLSLKISQEDTYRKFSSDYGVIVGRVVINGGFGVPNAKVSVFVPLDDVDKDNPLISGLYPYEVISDKDSDGIRYNLLTKESGSENECFTPIGTFPTKREVLDNDSMIQVYEKYYKFTSTTNFAGDFMFFGVPLGSHIVHVDADISDIGIASQRPYDLISQGAPVAKFDSSTKFLKGTNLDKLVQVKTLNAGVNVLPFWGDTEEFEIGVTRLDLDLNYDIIPSAIFMGSIYGDQDKHSVNKRCRPRKKLGELSEQVTGEGNIKMIRKTFNNQIEEFNVDGGELIDENGAWAYQIPMNLDYMVTAEDGTLILSEDQNKGIPTRARVRFNIGLADTGGDGRLRTRARYLVPNNPYTKSQVDYEFGSKTKDTSFRDLYWNKIYTVSNFISRFQRNNSFTTALTRNATGIKNVDGGDGSKTPFPYNKVNTDLNPIFFIICLIMKIIIFLLFLLNNIIFPVINAFISAWNSVMKAFCKVSGKKILKVKIFSFLKFTCKLIMDLIPCASVKCPFDGEETFSPGCKGGGKTFNATNPRPTYYSGDAFGHNGLDVGLDDCIAFEMAKTLNMFQFDFYNDWVNGSLFSYLLKYKKRKNGVEKFCEYNCDDIAGGGSDGNQNGSADNGCLNSLILDSCFSGGKDSQKENRRVTLNEGLIKKSGNQFYYAATDKEARFKLYATDIVNLGSVFECDWLGIPKIQKSLIHTTYKMPPDTQELTDDNLFVETSGMVDIGGNTCGSFFSINCLGLHVNARQCLNIRHICEMGTDIDQALIDPVTGNFLTVADCIIGPTDIDDASGKWFRDVFLGLNDTSTPWVGDINITLPYTSNFNVNSSPTYNFASSSDNGPDYVRFRGYGLGTAPISDGNAFGQPKHSYFFYFGLTPGASGLDKMNKKFFTNCIQPIRANIVIESNSTPDSGETGNGSIIFSFIGGVGPFNYVVTGLNTPSGNPLNITPISGTVNSNVNVIINGLFAGTYLISGVDSVGTPVSDVISVTGPVPLYCFASVTSNASSDIAADGIITLSSVGGGIAPLFFEVRDKNGVLAGTPSNGLAVTNTQIIGLLTDTSIGYTVRVYDSDSPVNECITSGLTITGPSAINLTYSATNVHCFGEATGTITLNITGGETPYDINVTGPYDFNSTGDLELENLVANPAGIPYIVTVVDALGSATTASIMIFEENPELKILEASDVEIRKQCDPNNYIIPFYITAGVPAGLVNVEYSVDDSVTWIANPMTFVNSTTPMIITLPKASVPDTGVSIRFYVDNPPCYSDEISYDRAMMELPPSILAINDVDTPLIQYQNNKQCSVDVATYRFSINHLDVGYTIRAPYLIEYKVEGSATINSFQHYGGLVTLSGTRNTNPANGPVDNIVKFEVRITDTKGCITPWHTKNITLPTAPLVGTITVSGSGPTQTRTISATGGIGPYTESGIALPRTITSSSIYVANIIDSVGCTTLIIG